MVEIGSAVTYHGSLSDYSGEEFTVVHADSAHAARFPEDYPDGYAYTLESVFDGVALRQVRRGSFTVL